jgi:hypothetical protein
MQKILGSNTQGCQTDLNFADLLQREQKIEQRCDQVELEAFKLQEKIDQLEYLEPL